MAKKFDQDLVCAGCSDLLDTLEYNLESVFENLELNKKEQKALIEMYIASVNEKHRFDYLLKG